MKTLVKDENLLEGHRLKNYDYQVGILDTIDYPDTRRDELAVRFNGIYRLLDFIDEHKTFGNRRPRESYDASFEHRDSDSWVQFSTYDESIKMMRTHPERFRGFDESDIKIYDEESVGNSISFDKVGDYIDIGRYLEGTPDCFGVMQGGRFERRFCSIVVNISASCNVSKETIDMKAKRTLRLVDLLEMNGVRCEVGLLSTTGQVHCEIIAKNYRDPLDINELAIGLSPDFFRWAIFRLTEHSKKCSAGYGHPNSSTLDRWTDADADNTIYIDSLRSNPDKEYIDKKYDDIEKLIKEIGLEKGRSFEIAF